MPNYMQYDPRTPRASAPRGIAPQNYAKQAMAGRSPYGQAPMPRQMTMEYRIGRDDQGPGLQVFSGVDHSPMRRLMGIPDQPAITIPMAGRTVDLRARPMAGGNVQVMPQAPQPNAGGLFSIPQRTPGLTPDYPPPSYGSPAPSPAPAAPQPAGPGGILRGANQFSPLRTAPPQPAPDGVFGGAGRVPVPPMPAAAPWDNIGLQPPPDLPVGPSNDIAPPFPGSPLARRGSFNAPLSPIAQMSPGEARAQVQSPYGVGTANGYVSRPGERVPFNQLMAGMSPQDRAIAAGDSGGPFGSMGGSSSRAAGLATLAQNMPQPPAAGGAPLPWNPALMAQVQAQRKNPTTPQAIEQANLWRNAQRLNPTAPNYDPAYAARWNANRYGGQLGAAGIDTNGMSAAEIQSAARSVANSRAQAMAQNRSNYFAQRSGRRVASPYGQAPMPGLAGNGRQNSGTGLDAPPPPFADLQPVSTPAPVTPERRNDVLSLINSVNENTPPAEIARIRGLINQGEIEQITSDLMPSNPLSGKWREFNQLQEKIRRIKGTYQSPEQQKADPNADPFGARSISSTQF